MIWTHSTIWTAIENEVGFIVDGDSEKNHCSRIFDILWDLRIFQLLFHFSHSSASKLVRKNHNWFEFSFYPLSWFEFSFYLLPLLTEANFGDFRIFLFKNCHFTYGWERTFATRLASKKLSKRRSTNQWWFSLLLILPAPRSNQKFSQ